MDSVSIKLKVGGVEIPSHPVFGDDVKLKISKEEKQVFYRVKVDGKIKFVGSDFDFISSCSHNEVFTLEVYRGANLFGKGTFLKSDCTLNYDDKTCDVKLVTTDQYEDFLATYDNKYNLPKLAPEIETLTLNKRPVLQFYFIGDTKITNAFGNMSFEVDAAGGAEEKDEAGVLACGFTKVFHWRKTRIPSFPSYPSLAGIEGDYEGQFTTISVGSRLYRTDGLYYLQYIHYTESGYDTYLWQLFNSNGTAFDNNGKVWVQAGNGVSSEQLYDTISWGNNWGGTALTVGFAKTYNRACYARALSDYSGAYSGETKKAFSAISEDVAETNYNYKYAWTVSFLNLSSRVLISSEVQAEPTEYGVDGDGNYFVKPTPQDVVNAIYPIGWSMWIPISIWLETSPSMDASLREAYNTTYQLRDAYPLHSAIQRLLAAMGSEIEFENYSPYSQFLYSYSDGLMDVLPSPAMRHKRVFITPITNVKKTRYEQAAQRGDITLKQILDMLRDVYQCYWYLDGVGRLCIEHISFFKHNFSYGLYTPEPTVKLPNMKDMPNKLPWSFGTNSIGFDRKNCPSRYEFQWGDECTEQFNGYAIDILDEPSKDQSKEKINVSNFTADIDYTVINPSGVGDDIYAVIEAGMNDGAVSIEEISLNDSSPLYSMQNGNLSLLFSERYYYAFDLGGWDAVCEGSPIEVQDVRHLITQDVGVPLEGFSLIMPYDIEFIRTGIGVGMLKDAEINADTMFSKTKLTMAAEKDDYRGEITLRKTSYSHGTCAIQIQNTSDVLLDVKYSYNGSVSTVTISAGSSAFVAYGSCDSLDVSSVTILSATRNTEHNTPIGHVVKRYQSHMEVSVDQYMSNEISVSFYGNQHSGTPDFAYIRIHLVKDATVQISASCEQTYDFGYAAIKPCTSLAQVQSVNGIYASGETGSASRVFEAGTDIYVGYSKDDTLAKFNDGVAITITEV